MSHPPQHKYHNHKSPHHSQQVHGFLGVDQGGAMAVALLTGVMVCYKLFTRMFSYVHKENFQKEGKKRENDEGHPGRRQKRCVLILRISTGSALLRLSHSTKCYASYMQDSELISTRSFEFIHVLFDLQLLPHLFLIHLLPFRNFLA
jgi:hypothetical protein